MKKISAALSHNIAVDPRSQAKGSKIKRTRGEFVFDIFNHTLLIIFAATCLYPFLNMLALTFNSGTDSMRGGITIFPRDFTLANYASILRDGLIIGAYKVTIARAVIGTLGSVFVTALVAYGLSARGLPGKKYIMIYFMIPMFFSGGLIPYFLTIRSYGLYNTFWVYIIPGLFSIWNCIVMKSSFQQIPESLKESMRIDGANELRIFFQIVVPLSMPMFAAISLFVSVGHWNDWFTGMYYIRKTNLIPVQTYLQQIMTRNLSQFTGKDLSETILGFGGGSLMDYSKISSTSLKLTAVMVGTIPILVIYPFLQKYFAKGVLVGSIKE